MANTRTRNAVAKTTNVEGAPAKRQRKLTQRASEAEIAKSKKAPARAKEVVRDATPEPGPADVDADFLVEDEVDESGDEDEFTDDEEETDEDMPELSEGYDSEDDDEVVDDIHAPSSSTASRKGRSDAKATALEKSRKGKEKVPVRDDEDNDDEEGGVQDVGRNDASSSRQGASGNTRRRRWGPGHNNSIRVNPISSSRPSERSQANGKNGRGSTGGDEDDGAGSDADGPHDQYDLTDSDEENDPVNVDTLRAAAANSGNNKKAAVRPLIVAWASNVLGFTWHGYPSGARLGVMLAVFNVTFAHLKFLPMGKATLMELKKKNPDYMIPPEVLKSNDKQIIKLMRDNMVISNPGALFALADGTMSPDKHATLLFPLAGVSEKYKDFVADYVRDTAERTRTPFLDRTSDPSLILGAGVVLPPARLLKATPSELYVTNVLRMMPLYRYIKALPSFGSLKVPGGKVMHVLKDKADVDTYLKLLRLLKVEVEIRHS